LSLGAFLFFLVTVCIFYGLGISVDYLVALVYGSIAVIIIFSGVLMLRNSTARQGIGHKIAGWSLILGGAHQADYFILRHVEWLLPLGFIIGTIFAILAATGLMIASFENISAAKIAESSARIQAEEALQWSENKFSFLFRFLPDPIMLIEEKTLRLVDVNDSFLGLFGLSHEEAVGSTTLDLGIYVDVTKRDQMRDRLLAEGHVENFEVEYLRKDGSKIICAVSAQAVKINDKGYGIVILRDVTEYKKMQEVMIQTEKMMSLGGLAAGIAHEINNPLGIVLQACENIRTRSDPNFPKNQETAAAIGLDMELYARYNRERRLDGFLEDIRTAALRTSVIIRRMLDFSRLNKSERKSVNICDIIESSIRLACSDYDLIRNYDFKQMTIVRDYADALPKVFCSAIEIEQVFLNLLRNAAQALVSSEKTVDDPRIIVRVKENGGYLRVEIGDNGPGMPLEVQKRVFEPFFTTKPTGVGTGLGLSVSYFIVTQGHGGRMDVTSQPGEGTNFIVELPVKLTPGTVREQVMT